MLFKQYMNYALKVRLTNGSFLVDIFDDMYVSNLK